MGLGYYLKGEESHKIRLVQVTTGILEVLGWAPTSPQRAQACWACLDKGSVCCVRGPRRCRGTAGLECWIFGVRCSSNDQYLTGLVQQ